MIVTQKCADFIIKGRMTVVQPSGMMVQYNRQGGSKIPCRVFKVSDIYRIFIALLELIFSIVRPEWKDITKQIQYQETQNKISTLKQKDEALGRPAKENDPPEDHGIPEDTDSLPFRFVDVSKLKVVVIDKNTIRDASRFKMTK